jgi:hypothetical protein
MDDDAQAALGTASSIHIMLDHALDCFTLLTATQIQFLALRSAAAAAAAAAAALTVLPVLSHKMTAILPSASTSSSSYFGTLDFLDSQSAFDTVFTEPVPLLVTPSAASTPVDSVLLLATLPAFVDLCKFIQLFVPIFCCDCVGTADRDNTAFLHATIQL